MARSRSTPSGVLFRFVQPSSASTLDASKPAYGLELAWQQAQSAAPKANKNDPRPIRLRTRTCGLCFAPTVAWLRHLDVSFVQTQKHLRPYRSERKLRTLLARHTTACM